MFSSLLPVLLHGFVLQLKVIMILLVLGNCVDVGLELFLELMLSCLGIDMDLLQEVCLHLGFFGPLQVVKVVRVEARAVNSLSSFVRVKRR